jgi:hypothetical protein
VAIGGRPYRVEAALAKIISLVGELFRIAFERRKTFDASRASALPWRYGIGSNLARCAVGSGLSRDPRALTADVASYDHNGLLAGLPPGTTPEVGCDALMGPYRGSR